MAHFAKLDENSIVLSVHSVENNVLLDDGIEIEQKGIDFLSVLHNHNSWKQTSYNGRFRKNYAGIGYVYDIDKDAFIPPKMNCHPEETLNLDTCRWECANEEHTLSL